MGCGSSTQQGQVRLAALQAESRPLDEVPRPAEEVVVKKEIASLGSAFPPPEPEGGTGQKREGVPKPKKVADFGHEALRVLLQEAAARNGPSTEEGDRTLRSPSSLMGVSDPAPLMAELAINIEKARRSSEGNKGRESLGEQSQSISGPLTQSLLELNDPNEVAKLMDAMLHSWETEGRTPLVLRSQPPLQDSHVTRAEGQAYLENLKVLRTVSFIDPRRTSEIVQQGGPISGDRQPHYRIKAAGGFKTEDVPHPVAVLPPVFS